MNGSSTTNASAVYGTLGVASSSTTPGAYTQQTANPSWSDSSGDFWLFDGNVWEFNPAADQWTWVSENGTAVVYGTKGTASTSNWPGGAQERHVGLITAAISGFSVAATVMTSGVTNPSR